MLAKTNLGSISFLGAGSGQQLASGLTSASPNGFGGGFQSIFHSLRNGPRSGVGGQVAAAFVPDIGLEGDGLLLKPTIFAADSFGSEPADSLSGDLRMLRRLLGDLVSQAGASGKPATLALKSDALGEMRFRFDPDSKMLTITVDGSSEADLEQALAGLFNLLAGLDIQQVQVTSVDGRAVSGKLLAGKSLMPESRPVGRGDVEGKSRHEATVAKRRAEGVTAPKLLAAEQTKASAKLDGFADAVKLADAEVVERLRSVIAAARDLLPRSGRKKMHVALNSESKGKFVVETEQTPGHSKSRVYVASRDVEKWLRQQLSQKGIQVDEIVVRPGKLVKGLRAFGSEQQTASASVAQRQVVSGNVPDVPRQTAAAGHKGDASVSTLLREISGKATQLGDGGKGIVQEPEMLSAQLKDALAQGRSLNHEIKMDSAGVEKWLEKQLQPVLQQISKERLPVERLVISRDGIVQNDLTKRLLPQAEAVRKKGPATFLGKSQSLASALSRDDAGSSLKDEANLSGGTETKKRGIQLADEPKVDSLRFGESFGARVAAFEEGEGEKLTFSSANGTVHFESVNGRLVATNAVHASSMAETIQKISELVEQQAKSTNHKLQVQMDVKDVGKVLVDATKQANKINLLIHVESTEARRLLEAQLRPLVEQMAKEGIDIGKLDVSVRDDRTDEQARFGFSQENHDRRDFKSEQETNRFKDGGEHSFATPEAGRNQLKKNENGNQTLEIWA